MNSLSLTSKLYANLTSRERAVIAFSHLAQGDELEFHRILRSVPTKRYICPDLEFQWWVNTLFAVSQFWGLEHWKHIAQRTAAIAILRATSATTVREETLELLDNVRQCECRLLTLEATLEDFCQDLGLSSKAIRLIVGCTRFEGDDSELSPDRPYRALLQRTIDQLLDPSSATLAH